MPGHEGACQRIRARLRHDLHEADHGGDEEEYPHHGENAEHTEDDFVVERLLEENKGRRSADQHECEQENSDDRTAASAAFDQRWLVVAAVLQLRHQPLTLSVCVDAHLGNFRHFAAILF